MSRTDVFKVRHDSLVGVAESSGTEGVINRMGSLVVTDLFTQLILSGYGYHMQAGTESTGDEMTTSIDAILVAGIADNPSGNAMIPLLYEATPGVVADTAALAMAMLEVDKDKVRFADDASGTIYTPANLRTDDPNSASGDFLIMEGSGVVATAKSAVPNSVELGRKYFLEDALANTIGYPGTWDTVVYSINSRPACVLIGPSSCVLHFGSGTALMTAYYVFQFAQFPKALAV